MTRATTPWILGRTDNETEGRQQRLFCFPHAGSGASVFRRWPSCLPASVQCLPVQIPGRENRITDPLPDTVEEVAAAAVGALLPLLRPPYLLFGHSFGGLLAFAVARRLRELGHPLPRALLISGARPPHSEPETAFHTLPYEELLSHVRASNGIAEPLLEHGDFVRRLLDVLRADLRLAAGYRPDADPRLPCPTLVLAADDDQVVPPSLMQEWRDYTTGDFAVRRAPGDHYAVYDVDGGLFGEITRLGSVDR